jgi:hypothetical protein
MSHAFPVSLQDVFTKSGKIAPRVRAVVRGDTDEPIATVSKRYTLVPHADVVNQANKYMERLGTPDINIKLSPNGAVMVSEYTYRDKTLAVNTGDVVGLRVYARNSYNGTTAVSLSIGALVLKCLNGMVMPHNIFSLSAKHVGTVEFEFPEPDMIMDRFTKSVGVLRDYSQIHLNTAEYASALEQAKEETLLSEGTFNKIIDQAHIEDPSVWGLYNDLTWDVTHASKANYVAKVGKLNRIAHWIDDKYGVNRNVSTAVN